MTNISQIDPVGEGRFFLRFGFCYYIKKKHHHSEGNEQNITSGNIIFFLQKKSTRCKQKNEIHIHLMLHRFGLRWFEIVDFRQ